jgi:hypothetical protein
MRSELSESIMDKINGAIETPPNPIDRLIERWWEDHFPGSAVARDTAAWNVAHAAKETLKRLLARARARSLPQPTTGDEDLQGSI